MNYLVRYAMSIVMRLSSILVVVFVSGCTHNLEWRTRAALEPVDCTEKESQAGCSTAFIQKHKNYDLAFVEFTEQGNVINRQKMDKVLNYIKEKTKDNDGLKVASSHGGTDGHGVYVLVYVHGWRHNAKENDSNVRSFRRSLAKLGCLKEGKKLLQNKHIIGVYVGWRGLSVSFRGMDDIGDQVVDNRDVDKCGVGGKIAEPIVEDRFIDNIELFTYWERKSVAQAIGKGGVTELLLRLEDVLKVSKDVPKDAKNDTNRPENWLQVVGHSMGGAILLSALNEILMERIVNAKVCDSDVNVSNTESTCREPRAFGNGVVLLNPAIEASQIMQLKELASQYTYPEKQDAMIYVVSSDGDAANISAFPMGQRVRSIFDRFESLARKFKDDSGGKDKDITFDEIDLETTTVAQFKPFRTSLLTCKDGRKDGHFCDDWYLQSCNDAEEPCESLENEGKTCICGIEKSEFERTHIPTKKNNPLKFIFSGKGFIHDHNDIFNDNVIAYMAAIHGESICRQRNAGNPGQCTGFDFEDCFNSYYNLVTKTGERGAELEEACKWPEVVGSSS